jgi:hypothetical protein
MGVLIFTGVQQQKEVLEFSLAQRNFLVTVESLLSTQVDVIFHTFHHFQGHEMGMIEDMDAAILWLSSVTIRLVTSIQQVSSENQKGEDHKKDRKRSVHMFSNFIFL